MTDELLFYGGAVCAAAAFLAEIVCLLLFRIKKLRLDAKMDQEYGPKESK